MSSLAVLQVIGLGKMVPMTDLMQIKSDGTIIA
jgi:hypothetical protein